MSRCDGWCYHLKIELAPGEVTYPEIYRQIQVPGAITFHELHKAISVAFQWGWNEENYDYHFKPDSISIHTKRPVALNPSEYSDSKETFLAEVVERSHFDANLIYTYITLYGLRYEHQISVMHKMRRWTDADDLCIFTEGRGHCMAEGRGLRQWAKLKEIYRLEPELRCASEIELTNWYEQNCTNGNPLGLWNARAFDYMLETKPGAPLGSLGAEYGCVVPEGKVAEFCIKLTSKDPPRCLIDDRARRLLRATESQCSV